MDKEVRLADRRLGLAFEYELIARVPRIKMERVQRRDPGFLDEDEVARLLASAPEEWRLVLLTAVRTGLHHQRLWKVVSGTARATGLKKHAHPHLLRHTFASHCYQRGIPPQVVQQWMGHAQISTTAWAGAWARAGAWAWAGAWARAGGRGFDEAPAIEAP